MAVTEIDNGIQLGQLVYLSSDKLICILFTKSGPSPCGILEHILRTFSAAYPNVIFLKVCVDRTPNAVPEQIRIIPTFLFVYNMAKVGSFEGSCARKLHYYLDHLTRNPYSPIVEDH